MLATGDFADRLMHRLFNANCAKCTTKMQFNVRHIYRMVYTGQTPLPTSVLIMLVTGDFADRLMH